METLNDLLLNQLRMVYSMEEQMIAALPKLIGEATDEKLQSAFTDHLEETKAQRNRLDEIASDYHVELSRYTSEAMKGLIKETKNFLGHNFTDHIVKDAGLAIHAQKIEHYEIAAYGSICAIAEELNYDETKEKLEETLKEEQKADNKLNKIEERLNSKAEKS